MPTGTVKFFNSDTGHGFIAPDDRGSDCFVHITSVERSGSPSSTQDQRVTYPLETDRRGMPSALSLRSV